MFLFVSNEYAQMLINLDNIANIVSRHIPSDASEEDKSKGDWEIGVFLENKHLPTPNSQTLVWTGTYEVILRGSVDDCHDYIARLSQLLPDCVSVDVDMDQ
jgi:hypothetical protein